MRWKKWLENTALRFGFVAIPVWRAGRLDQERHLKRLLNHLNIDCVFDIGANTGQYADLLRNHASYQGNILSFEPHPSVFRQLQQQASPDPNWKCFEYALGNQNGKAVLHANAQSDLSSLKSISGGQNQTQEVSITIQRLQDIMPQFQSELGFCKPFLKMDTQGSELDIALGAGPMLHDFCAIQSEISFNSRYADAPTYDEVLSFYEKAGFKISRLCPIHEASFPLLGDMDLFLINEKYL